MAPVGPGQVALLRAAVEQHARQQQPQLPGTLGRDMPVVNQTRIEYGLQGDGKRVTHRATNKNRRGLEHKDLHTKQGQHVHRIQTRQSSAELGIGEVVGLQRRRGAVGCGACHYCGPLKQSHYCGSVGL